MSMSGEITAELRVFLVFVLHGMCVLAANDVLRGWRLAVPHGAVWTGVEDLLFWFFAALWTFVMVFIYQDGVLRLYAAVAMGLGGILYRETVSRLVVRGTGGFLRLVIRAGRKAGRGVRFCFAKTAGMVFVRIYRKTVAFFGKKG